MAKLILKKLKKQLNYDSLTGIFTRKIPNRRLAIGDVVGTNTNGYIEICLNEGKYLAHRLAWFYVHGYMPEYGVDHIDKNPLHRHHNWITNLREASKQCNARNPKNNTSTVKGVSWYKAGNKWQANIRANDKQLGFGHYKDFDEAVCHRLAAEQCFDWSNCDSNSPAFEYVKNNIQSVT